MSKRRTESTSSSSTPDWESSSNESSSESSIDDPTDPSFTLGYGEAKKKRSGLSSLAKFGSRKKARNGSTEEIIRSSSSSSSDGDCYGEAKPPLSNEKGSCKKTKNCSAEQRETSPVASTSAQLQQELEIIVKDEPEECEQTQDSACSTIAASHESNPEVNRSRRERVSSKVERYQCQWTSSKDPNQPPRPKKVSGPKPHEKYFEGCLVMGWINFRGFPWWPGMIRKASSEEDPKNPDYTSNYEGKTWLFVQFFIDRTTCYYLIPRNLRVFNPARPNRCTHWDPILVAEFEKGIRIARAAANFSVEDRLTNFTLPEDTRIDGLLRDIDRWNAQHASRDDSVPHEQNGAALEAGGQNAMIAPQNDTVTQEEDVQAPPTQRNRRSITDVVAGLKKKDREREEAIKALKTDNSKLTADYSKLAEELEKVKSTNRDLTLRLQSKDVENGRIESLEGKLKDNDKLIAELRKDNEQMRSEVASLEELLDVDPGT